MLNSRLLVQRGYGKLFDETFSSASVGYKKPQEEFYEYVIARIPFEKKDVLYWDDDPKHIEVAEKLGMPSNLYTTVDDFRATVK